MSTTAKYAKDILKQPKYAVRHRNRCLRCGRPRAYMRKLSYAVSVSGNSPCRANCQA